MPKFAYAAIDASGATIEGFEKGDTLGDVRATLLAKNLYPVKIEEKRGALQFEISQEKVKKKELMHFTRQLSVFVRAGIPITEALDIIGDETADVALRRTIVDMTEDLRNGGTLSDAAASTPRPSPTTTWASCSRPS
jgi:type IV pilus assembly protein PilC